MEVGLDNLACPAILFSNFLEVPSKTQQPSKELHQ
jgi:hypothetical protein